MNQDYVETETSTIMMNKCGENAEIKIHTATLSLLVSEEKINGEESTKTNIWIALGPIKRVFGAHNKKLNNLYHVLRNEMTQASG